MHHGQYGLGIDVGHAAIRTATCSAEPDADGEVPEGKVLAPAEGGQSLQAGELMDRVGTPTPLYLDGRPVPAGEAVAAVVAHAQALAEARLGTAPAQTVLTVPPSWGAHRCAELADALRAAGGPPVALVSAAVAVVHHHLAAGDVPGGVAVAVYDVGARTVDTAVVGAMADGSEHLGVPPEPLPWGGDDIDDVVVARVLHGADRAEVAELSPAATGRLRERCVAAKEALSTETAVGVELGLASVAGSVRLTREELDEQLDGPVEESIDLVRQALTAADVTTDDVRAVLLAGGTARLPLIAERLSAALRRPLVVGSDPAWTAALGAARMAADAVAAEPEQPAGPAADELLPRRRPQVARASAAGPERRGLHRALVVAALLAGLLIVPSVLFAALGLDHAGSVVGQSVAEAEQVDTSPAAQSGGGTGTGRPAAGTSPSGSQKATAPQGSSDGGPRARSTSVGPGTSAAPLPGSSPATTPPGAGTPAAGTPTPAAASSGTPSSGPTTGTIDPAPGPATDPSTSPPTDPSTGPVTDPAPAPDPSTEPPTDTASPPASDSPPEPPAATDGAATGSTSAVDPSASVAP